MEAGKYYDHNQKRLAALVEKDWRIALGRCKAHIRWKLKQKTLSGAHAAARLGSDPVEYYLGIAYEKILSGVWEWQDQYSLGEQMIRVAGSYISKEVKKAVDEKEAGFRIIYKEVEEEFYEPVAPYLNAAEKTIDEARLKEIEDAVAGDEQLEFIVEGIKDGKKRAVIADLLGIGLRQFDKLREKLVGRIKSLQTSTD